MPTPTAEEQALGVTFVSRDQLAEGHVVRSIDGELHQIDHFENSVAPIFNPDPERTPSYRVAVARDGWSLTLRAAYVPVLTEAGPR